MRISDWSSDVCSSDLAIAGHQRKDMARRDDILRTLRRIDRDLDGPGAVGGRDARGHAFRRLDRDGEGGLERRLVFPHHQRQAEPVDALRSEEHTSELQSLMRISYAVFCLKKKTPRPH